MRSGTFPSKLYQHKNPANSIKNVKDNVNSESQSGTTSILDSCVVFGNGSPIDTDGYTYGFVFFRQERDSSIRRGFFQKSLVLLTPHPWHGLFSHIISFLGSRFMNALMEDRITNVGSQLRTQLPASANVLLKACSDIAAWPTCPASASPNASFGQTQIDISFLGHVQKFTFAPSSNFPQLFDTSRPISKQTVTELSMPSAAFLIEDLTVRMSSPDLYKPKTGKQSESVSNSGSATPKYTYPNTVAASSIAEKPYLTCPGRFFELFEKQLDLLWLCWELMVVGESIIVVAETPKGCSDIVLSLVELIKPIPFGGDYRPYFTIQDTDFKTIATRNRPPSSATILGVTNPVFSTLLDSWPNVIRVARHNVSEASTGLGLKDTSLNFTKSTKKFQNITGNVQKNSPFQSLKATLSPTSNSTSPNASPPVKSSTYMTSMTSELISTLKNTNSTASLNNVNIEKNQRISFESDDGIDISIAINMKGVGLLIPDSYVESLSTKHKSFLTKDKKLIKSIIECGIVRGYPSQVLDNLIRRHFMELTDRFLQPLNRYFETLIVGNPKDIKPEIKPFQQETFLKMVESNVPTLPVSNRRPIPELYRNFLKSPNFASWLQHRTTNFYRDWRRRYLSVLSDSDISQWMANRDDDGDVECVDLLMRLKDELTRYQSFFDVEDEKNEKRNSQFTIGSSSSSSRGKKTGNVNLSWSDGDVLPSAEQYQKIRYQLNILTNAMRIELNLQSDT
ncbi:Protein dennd6b [Nowakowskiella sp. JEL0407]|nr:Protein dennd6b [Nowakowskiella sp. JEL0407]